MSARKSLDQVVADLGTGVSETWSEEGIERLRQAVAECDRQDAWRILEEGTLSRLMAEPSVNVALAQQLRDAIPPSWLLESQPDDRSTGFLIVFFSIVGFALGCLATVAVLYLKAWGG